MFAICCSLDEKLESTKLEMDKNFLAIKAVHAHLDDDRDGNIDTDESVEVRHVIHFHRIYFCNSIIHTFQHQIFFVCVLLKIYGQVYGEW